MWKAKDEIFGLYRIDQILHDGLERIYVAEHLRSKAKVAIRRPDSHILDQSFSPQFVDQAKAWMQLGYHPNIVSCYFVHYIDEVPHLFTEYADGGELREWIEDGRCADLRVGLDLAIQFCHGMTHVHSRGMIHRDLKPSNVLMTKKGLLKINDFLIALNNPDKGNDLHSPGKSQGHAGFIGTIAYASPEQFRDADQVGPESDVYSFGVCLWEMLLGRRPYQNAMEESTLYDPLTLRPEIPKELADLLSQLVSWNPGVRIALGGFKTLQDRFSNIYRKLFDDLWIPGFMLRNPNPLIQWTHYLALARELGAELVADWLKLAENDLLNPSGIESTVEKKELREEGKQEENRRPSVEYEIKAAAQLVERSKYCFSPSKNILAYILDDSLFHCNEQYPTYMGISENKWQCSHCGVVVPGIPDRHRPSEEPAVLSIIATDTKHRRGILGFLTSDAHCLKWSPDGKYISVISHAGKRLWVVDAVSRETRVVHAGEEVFTDHFWSPTSEFIAVIGYRQKGEHEHYFVKIYNNSELTSVVPQTIYHYNQQFHWPGWGGVYSGFAWSPLGRQYAVGDNYGFRIFSVNGGLHDEFIDSEAIIGTKILMWPIENMLVTSWYDTGTDYLINDSIKCFSITGSYGNTITVLNADNAFLNSYALSPDNTKFAHSRSPRRFKKNGVAAYYSSFGLFDIDKGKELPFENIAVLTDGYHRINAIVKWSPDGSYIMFCSDGVARINGEEDPRTYDEIIDPQSIWIMNADDSDIRKLANGYDASWSYDGSMIAFVKELEGGERKLYVLDFKGWLQDKG